MIVKRRAVLSAVTPPSELPLTRDEVKERLDIDHGDDDIKIDGLIAVAVQFMDGRDGALNRCLITQTWDEKFERFEACKPFKLALSPVQSVTSVKYFDPDGVEQTVSSADYEVEDDGDLWFLRAFAGWPNVDRRRTYPITVRYVVGFGDAGDVPQLLKEALMVHVGALYESRGVTPLALASLGYTDLIAGHRRPSL